LDSEKTLKSVDRKGMLGTIDQMPNHLLEGLRKGRSCGLPRFTPRNLFICGVGGSAIGGDILCQWLHADIELPCSVIRSYGAPRYLTKDSLVIVASYSGDTEETIAMFEEAKKRRAKIVVITSGGRLATASEKLSIPTVTLPSGMMPRATLGFMLGAMIGTLERTGLASADKEIEEAARVLIKVVSECRSSVPTIDNPAKKMAHQLFGRIPLVIGYDISRPVAKRWSNQLHENAKSMSFSSELPELNHNEIVGWMKDGRSKGFSAIFLDHGHAGEAMRERVDATKEMLSRVAPVMSVSAVGRSPLAQIMSLVMVGDYVSVYLGIVRNEDPSSNEPIDELKSILSKKRPQSQGQ